MQHLSRSPGFRGAAPRRRAQALAAGVACASIFAVALSSCAVFDDTWDGGCILDCEPAPQGDGCTSPGQCAANQTCGDDAQCHPGNCSYWGCVAGYACVISESDTADCVPGDGASTTDGAGGGGGEGGQTTTGQGGGGQGGGGGGSGGATGAGGAEDAIYCGAPDDCAADRTCALDGTCQRGDCEDFACITGFVCEEGACVRQNASACGDDDDCNGTDLCVSGLCTLTSDLCFDGVQCSEGSSCADGKCVPSCAGGVPCPESFSCDDALGICSVPIRPCALTSDCDDADSVCVAGACVPRASGVDCGEGEVWVDNGCISDQSATVTCTVEGEQGECATDLLCVHGTCFVPCAPPNEDACAAIPGFETCSDVPAETGTYSVCGSESHLGGECDLSLEVPCNGELVCVDGTCL